MADPPLITFLVAGVQKGGTTALYDYLADMPDVALSLRKEVHFFDDEGQDWSRPDYQAYHANFAAPSGRPCGEATPIYSYWPRSLERIAAYNPALKFILVLRDPVLRAWSHWRMEFARGAETQPFPWCIRGGRQRLFDADPWGHHRVFSYVERGFYGEQVERLLTIFPQEQLLVLRSEELRDDRAVPLAAVRAFLDLPPAPPPPPRESHVGVPSPGGVRLSTADANYLREIYAADDARLLRLTGISFGG